MTPVSVGVLPYQDIVALGGSVIQPFDLDQVKTASYDMRVGREYYLSDDDGDGFLTRKFRTQELDNHSAGIVINQNALVIVTMHERLELPRDMVGHVSLKVERLLDGLIMANQSQIDAGYKGAIWALLYNLSNQPVTLKHLEACVRLELQRLEVQSDQVYDGTYKDEPTLQQALSRPVDSSLRRLALDFKKLKSSVRRRFAVGYTVAVLTLAATVALGFVGPFADMQHNVGELQGQQTEVSELKAQLKAEQKHLARLIRKIEKPPHGNTQKAGAGK